MSLAAEATKDEGQRETHQTSNQDNPSKVLPATIVQDDGVQAQTSLSQESTSGPSNAPDTQDIVPKQNGTCTRMENGGKEINLTEHSHHGDTLESYLEVASSEGALSNLHLLSTPVNGLAVSRNGIQANEGCKDAHLHVSGATAGFCAESLVVDVCNACSHGPDDAKFDEPSKHAQGSPDIKFPDNMEKSMLAFSTNHVNSCDNGNDALASAAKALTNDEETESSGLIGVAGVFEGSGKLLTKNSVIVQDEERSLRHSSLDEGNLDGKHNSNFVIGMKNGVVEAVDGFETERSNLVVGIEGGGPDIICPSLNASCLQGIGSSSDKVLCSPPTGEGLHSILEQDQSSEVEWPHEHSNIATVLVSNDLEGWHHFSPVDENGTTSPYGIGTSHQEPRRLEFWEHLLDDEANPSSEVQMKDAPLFVEDLQPCPLENHVGFSLGFPSPGNPFIEGPDTWSNVLGTGGFLYDRSQMRSPQLAEGLETGMVQDSAALTQATQLSIYDYLGSHPNRNDPLRVPSFTINKNGEANASTPYQSDKTVVGGRHPKGEESWEANFDLVFPCAQEITRSTSFPREGSGSGGLSFSHKGFEESGVLHSNKESLSATASPLVKVSHKLSPLMQKVAEKVRSTPVMANHVLTTARNTMMSPKVVIDNRGKQIPKNKKSIWACFRCCGDKG